MKKLSRSASRQRSWQFTLIAAAASVLILMGVGFWLEKSAGIPQQSVGTLSSIQPIVDAGVTWLGEPQVLSADLKLWQDSPGTEYYQDEKMKYYRLGSDSGQDILLAVAPAIDPSGPRRAIFLQGKKGYELLTKNSPGVYYNGQYSGPDLAKNVKENKEKIYQSIVPPSLITFKGEVLHLRETYTDYLLKDFAANESRLNPVLTKVADTAWGPLFSFTHEQKWETASGQDNIMLQGYVLGLPDGSGHLYQFEPSFVSAEYIPQITWNDGSVNKDSYRWDGIGGCGNPGYAAVVSPKEAGDLAAVGKTNTDETVYTFRNPNNAISKAYYHQLPEGKYYVYDAAKQQDQFIPISLEEYIAKHGMFVYRDKLGRNIVFQSNYYGTGAECGKPVIYLYPEKTTEVAVQVGAHITKSEPEYGQGWQVTAEPDGSVTTQDGQTYHSLFWEGLGHGNYPDITSGFVIARGDIETTLRAHLTKLGLNGQESQDFMDFWLPKMPKTPYVRLTWLGTRQMDSLALLHITPAPDTVIRLFLDFAGLQQPILLPVQQLSSIPRQGFTVVEWGGLLRAGN